MTIFDDNNNNKTAVPFLLHVLTCTTPPQGFLLNVRGLSLAIHSRRDSSRLKKNVTRLQLDIFSAFYVLFYLWLLKALSRQFCNLCAHKLNGCHLNNKHCWGLEPFLGGGGTVVKVSKGGFGFFFFNSFKFS